MPTKQNFPGGRVMLYAKEYSDAMRKQCELRLDLAAEEVKNHIVRKLREHKTRVEGPSKVGEYPHADTGRLSQGIFIEAEEMSRKVVAAADYGLVLEETGRSFMKRGLFEKQARVNQILTAKFKE